MYAYDVVNARFMNRTIQKYTLNEKLTFTLNRSKVRVGIAARTDPQKLAMR